jgi:hypothetical protein
MTPEVSVGLFEASGTAVVETAHPGLMVAVPASATSNSAVNVFACSGGDGTTTVSSGVPITIHGNGFAQGSFGLIHDFLLKQHTTLTLSDGTTAVYDLSPEWSSPVKFSPTFWVTSLPDTDLGMSLNPGQSILVTLDITFDPALLVAFPPVGPSGNNGPFLISEEGPASCLITGSS